MSFICPIQKVKREGPEAIRVEVPLTVLGLPAPIKHDFVFDTGCEVTMVSQDVAAELGVPEGGRRLQVHGLVGGGTGRLVNVRFRFPETMIGDPGLEVDSIWVVVSGRRNLALLGFQEVHRHFRIWTLEFDMYFIRW